MAMLDRKTLTDEITAILGADPGCEGRVSSAAVESLVELFIARCRELYGDRRPLADRKQGD